MVEILRRLLGRKASIRATQGHPQPAVSPAMREALRQDLSDMIVDGEPSLCPFAKRLLSMHSDVANAAIRQAWQLAESGKREAVEALEQAIRFKHGAADCAFYQPGVRLRLGQDMRMASERIVELAAQGRLWITSPYEVQELLSICSILCNWEDLLKRVEGKAGKEQARALLLLATHLQVRKLLGDL